MTQAEYNRLVRQQQQKLQREVESYNRKIKQHNQRVKQEIENQARTAKRKLDEAIRKLNKL